MRDWPKADAKAVRRIIAEALAEDLGEAGDITSAAVVGEDASATGRLIARRPGVVCGLEIARLVFVAVDERIDLVPSAAEGARVGPNATIATVAGPARGILAAERTALNILQHLCGVATATAEVVARTAGTGAKICDTRKTLPGLRALEKYAVAVGGGVNHRMGLFDGVLLKDNHLKAAGGIEAAVAAVRKMHGPDVSIEIEAETLDEVRQALGARADIIMLDNMPTQMMADAVRIAGGRAVLEASGGITTERVEEITATGVDRISMGALTDAPRLDISLEIDT